MSLPRQIIIATGLVVMASAGAAQQYPTPAPGTSVSERTRDAFEQKGFAVGEGIALKPSIGVREYFDSNVFATDSNEKDDTITQIRPGVRLQADRPTFSFEAIAEAALNNYTTMDDQNSVEWNVGAGGQYKFTPVDTARAAVSHRRVQISRSDPEEGGGSGEPRMAHVLRGEAGYLRDEGPYHYRLGADLRDWNYLDSRQEDRDRMDFLYSGRFGYEISPIVQPYAELFYEGKDYDLKRDFNGFERDAARVGALFGAEWKLGDAWTIDAAVGLAEWMFDEARFDDDMVWIARAGAGYNITPSTTLKAGFTRDETDTTRSAVSTRTSYGANLGVEHAVLTNFIVYADAAYRNISYKSDPREDDNYDFSIGGRYYFNSNFALAAQYILSDRESNERGADFVRNQVWIGLEAGF